MKYVRWTMILGAFLFVLGVTVLIVESNDALGFGLGFSGFALLFVGAVAGNWMVSRSIENKGFGKAYRLSIVGFCVATVGILTADVSPLLGTSMLVIGMVVVFVGILKGSKRIDRDGVPPR
jgi:hypothetical protein